MTIKKTMTIIKIDIEEDLTNLEYDIVNNLFKRKPRFK